LFFDFFPFGFFCFLYNNNIKKLFVRDLFKSESLKSFFVLFKGEFDG